MIICRYEYISLLGLWFFGLLWGIDHFQWSKRIGYPAVVVAGLGCAASFFCLIGGASFSYYVAMFSKGWHIADSLFT